GCKCALDFAVIIIYYKNMIAATKIRIYPDTNQVEKLAKAFGCARWLWNNSLNECQKTYQETGKGLGHFALNNRLPELKQSVDWLGETHSQVLQAVCLNLSRAFVSFFERRAAYPTFKSKHGKQSIQYPQGVKIIEGRKLFLPKIGHVKAVVHREITGTIKTVTLSKTPGGKYFASILAENGLDAPAISFDGKILGIDMGLTHLAITSDGSKFDNPKHVAKAQKNLKRKQQKLSRKVKGSNTRNKVRILVAKAHEKVANARKDYLHKLSRRLVNENQVIAFEDLHVKGMMRNHCLAKSIGDAGWGAFTGMLKYKTEQAGKGYIEVNRFFPSSKACSCCLHVQSSMPLTIRSWRCDKCGSIHDRDINAAQNIRNEAQRMIAAGIAGTANRGTVSQVRGRKSSVLARAIDVRSPVL
ncbi:MAG: RNA-guided endonuclease TnpB family protein, partial [Methylobacter sp.]|nr:RNA-guided endonuclease TnpB family protein [Methylobacter sp.]